MGSGGDKVESREARVDKDDDNSWPLSTKGRVRDDGRFGIRRPVVGYEVESASWIGATTF
jgi:hypothetical protein